MTNYIEVKAALSVTDAGEITGIAWPFGSADRVGDVIEKGAITAPATLPMLFAHDQGQVVGVWDHIAETDQGLTVKGRLLVDGVERAREVRAMIQSKAVTGLSIGFVTKQAKRHAKGRTITAAHLHEISVVAVPCHPGAQITSIKSDDTTMTIQERTHMEKEEIAGDQIDPKVPANDAPQIDTKAFEEMKVRLDRMEAKANRPRISHDQNPVMQGDETKAFAAYLRTGDRTEIKSLAYSSGTGGILAPETVSTSILEKIAEFSPVRSVAQTIQMNGPLLQLPRLQQEVDPAEVAEGAEKDVDEPTFDQIDLKPFEMGVVVPVTKILLEDAHIDLSAYLGNHIARRFGQKEATWFVNGNGTSQAEGVMVSADILDNEVASIDADALIDHYYGIKTGYASNGVWLMNRKTMALVRKLKDADGQYIWQAGLQSGQPANLLGRPVYEAVDMPDPTAGNSPIVFGDFAEGYAIADRTGFEIIRDELTGAASGMVKLIARRRVGGRVVMGEALAKLSLAA
ncbi:Phage major capsid protein, HK97 family [Sulfitobacter noctilucae]|uniref:phage major capsid protein n=1 Tax=Sulfitobacter noctilucae TaxID=1342302 RepID=UPI000469BDBC|nr:phage major capsid protein [Sulfitobacter noctilucae]KIN60637.1 Phage major capsid protein, HK97 family [Sulfitobacter noctilucae]